MQMKWKTPPTTIYSSLWRVVFFFMAEQLNIAASISGIVQPDSWSPAEQVWVYLEETSENISKLSFSFVRLKRWVLLQVLIFWCWMKRMSSGGCSSASGSFSTAGRTEPPVPSEGSAERNQVHVHAVICDQRLFPSAEPPNRISIAL